MLIRELAKIGNATSAEKQAKDATVASANHLENIAIVQTAQQETTQGRMTAEERDII